MVVLSSDVSLVRPIGESHRAGISAMPFGGVSAGRQEKHCTEKPHQTNRSAISSSINISVAPSIST